jgi:hypothetical protein
LSLVLVLSLSYLVCRPRLLLICFLFAHLFHATAPLCRPVRSVMLLHSTAFRCAEVAFKMHLRYMLAVLIIQFPYSRACFSHCHSSPAKD